MDSSAVAATSDKALAILRPGLVGMGFDVEAGKRKTDKIRRPVLFGEMGSEDLAYEVDAFQGLDTFTLMCNGETVTVVAAHGPTGWINGQHVVVKSFSFSGPEGTETQTLGKKTGLPATFTCVETEGPFTFTAVAAAVPPQRP